MDYSTKLITLPSEVDTLLKTAQRDKRIFENRKETVDLRKEDSADNAIERLADLNAARAELAAVTAGIEVLPEGAKKETEITKKMDLELRIRKLSESSSKKGAIAQIESEYDADLLDRQIDGADALIAALNGRKAEL